MNIRSLRTNEDYQWALREIETLMDAELHTEEGERLDVLATLVDAFERAHFPIDDPDPIDAIKFRMEQENLSPKDLVPYIGQSSHVYEVLNRKRPLSLRMVKKLYQRLKIPARVFLGT